MRTKFCLVILITIIVAAPLAAQSQAPQPEKAANIERLLKLVGADKLQQTMLNQIMEALKPLLAGNGETDEASRKILSRFSELMTEELQRVNFSSMSRELYDKYFTNDDIKGMIAFYETPLGQKTLQVLPALTSEAMSRGEKVGEQAGQRAFTRLAQEFPELKKFTQTQAR